METPWGKSRKKEITKGVYFCENGSHGGYYVEKEKNDQIPDSIKSLTFQKSGNFGFYEEDLDWVIPYLIFDLNLTEDPEYSEKNLDSAMWIAESRFPELINHLSLNLK